jgi:hypothetical protein
MIYQAQILTPWSQQGSAYSPQLARDHPVSAWTDVTGQPAQGLLPAPNLFTVQVVCDDATLAAIEADPTYSVLWSEPL